MTEKTLQGNYSQEAENYLREEVPTLTPSEGQALSPMLGMRIGGEQVTLEDAQAMIHMAKNPDEAEQMMYQQSTMKSIPSQKVK